MRLKDKLIALLWGDEQWKLAMDAVLMGERKMEMARKLDQAEKLGVAYWMFVTSTVSSDIELQERQAKKYVEEWAKTHKHDVVDQTKNVRYSLRILADRKFIDAVNMMRYMGYEVKVPPTIEPEYKALVRKHERLRKERERKAQEKEGETTDHKSTNNN